MKLLVTGASGFIGKNYLLSLPRDWEVWALYNRTTDFPEFLRQYELTHVRAVQMDLLQPEHVEKFVREAGTNFDLGVYFAANGDPARSVPAPIFDLESNTVALLRLCEKLSFGRFVYFSSGAVYDGLRGPVDPSVHINPKLPYAISKWASEQYLKHFQHEGRIQKLCNVRFFGAYGPFEPERKIYTKLVKQFAQKRDPVFTIRGDGSNLIDAMYVDDAVRAIQLLCEAPEKTLTVDLGNQAPLSLRELVVQAARVFGLEAEIKLEGVVPEYIEFRSTDNYMRERMHFVPKVPLSQGLPALAEFLSTRRYRRIN